MNVLLRKRGQNYSEDTPTGSSIMLYMSTIDSNMEHCSEVANKPNGFPAAMTAIGYVRLLD